MKDSPLKILDSGKQLFIGITFDRYGAIAKHIALWESITKIPKEQYSILKVQHSFSESIDVLFFTNKAALDQFDEWWSKYAARFPKDQVTKCTIPVPQDGEMMCGYPLRHPPDQQKNLTVSQLKEVYLDQWYWLAEHTNEPVWFTTDFWLFSNEAEMVMFKLRDKKIDDELDDDETASLNFYK